ncbi:MAG: hypothetical protein ABI432_14090 [Flavobacteriales bacterium]
MTDSFLDWFDRHKTGVIGTLAVHSALLFVFTLSTIRSQEPKEEFHEMAIEMVPDEEEQPMDPMELDANGMPKQVTNLTSNITAELKPSYNAQRMEERVESDLREMEQSEFDRLAQERHERGEEVTIPQLDPSKWNKERYMEKAAEPVRVEGATTVWHDLQGRVRSDDVPGYLCKEEGRVAVAIAVDRNGSVLKAEVDPVRSANADDCMIEQALRSAKRARFNGLSSAPDPQKGTVFFLFLPQ